MTQYSSINCYSGHLVVIKLSCFHLSGLLIPFIDTCLLRSPVPVVTLVIQRCSSRVSVSRRFETQISKFRSRSRSLESRSQSRTPECRSQSPASVSSLCLGLELFSLDYIEVNQPSKPIDQSGFSVCSHANLCQLCRCQLHIWSEWCLLLQRRQESRPRSAGSVLWSITTTSRVDMLDKIFCVPALSTPVNIIISPRRTEPRLYYQSARTDAKLYCQSAKKL